MKIIELSHLWIKSCERAFYSMRERDLFVGVFAFLNEASTWKDLRKEVTLR